MFVPPRPRGHAELLGRLQALASPLPSGQAPGSQVVLVSAPEGGGKSLVLRELKWRLQIRDARVLEIDAAGDVAGVLSSLVRQLEIALGGDARGLGRGRACEASARGGAHRRERADRRAGRGVRQRSARTRRW